MKHSTCDVVKGLKLEDWELIISKHRLTISERGSLLSYIKFMHPSSRKGFIRRLMRGDEEYLNSLTDRNLEDRANDMLGKNVSAGEIRCRSFYNIRDYPKLSTQYLTLYRVLVEKMRPGCSQVVYAYLGFNIKRYSSVEYRRVAFYLHFKRFVNSLSQRNFERLVNGIFDERKNLDVILFECVRNAVYLIKSPLEISRDIIRIIQGSMIRY